MVRTALTLRLGFRYSLAGVCGALAILGILGAGEFGRGSDDHLAASVWVVVWGMIALRSLRTGVAVERGGLIVRSHIRTRRIEWRNIASIRSVGYSGSLNRYSTSRILGMLLVELRDGSELEFPAIAGPLASVNRLAARIHDLLP